MKTQAAVLNRVGTLISVETLELGPPKRGEVLVRVHATGVCHSDWHLVTGDTQHVLPAVLGHEGAGVVEAVGADVTRVQVGDHVVLNWAPACGECFYCERGRPALCSTYVGPLWAGTMLDGTARFSRDGHPVFTYCGLGCFAERTVVPELCCIPIRTEIPFEVAALLGCAVATGVGAALNTARVSPGESVAVFGAGGVGLSVVLGARLSDARQVIVVDKSPAKLAMVRDFGATDAVPAGPDAATAIRRLTDGRGADVVFEAVGSPAVQEQSFQAVRPGGRLVLVGLSPMGSNTSFPSSLIVREEKSILGSYYGSVQADRDFPAYAAHFIAGRLPLDRLVTRRYALGDINRAYADLLTGDLARGVVVM